MLFSIGIAKKEYYRIIIFKKLIDKLENIKDFFQFLEDPINIMVSIEPYREDSRLVIEKIEKEIHNIYPNIPIHFIGSIPLEISGRKDVDLFIECPASEFNKYVSGINLIFGKYIRSRKKYIEWKTNYHDWEINALLIDPAEKKFKYQMLTFVVLKSNAALRQQYELLKVSLNGAPLLRYEETKRRFFAKVIKEIEH